MRPNELPQHIWWLKTIICYFSLLFSWLNWVVLTWSLSWSCSQMAGEDGVIGTFFYSQAWCMDWEAYSRGYLRISLCMWLPCAFPWHGSLISHISYRAASFPQSKHSVIGSGSGKSINVHLTNWRKYGTCAILYRSKEGPLRFNKRGLRPYLSMGGVSYNCRQL